VGRWATKPGAASLSPSVGAAVAPPSPRASVLATPGSGPAGLSGEAEAAKVLVRMLRREGRFAAAKVAAERYRRLRLSPSP